ncbi:hypothetical protein SDC9_71778 [bioreactor metagenome]|uniref:Uncharacterized protein n=1 Tax=bioreactor metagenome TaxID=1076179 RepID=A0A644YBF6_9ZZZZ
MGAAGHIEHVAGGEVERTTPVEPDDGVVLFGPHHLDMDVRVGGHHHRAVEQRVGAQRDDEHRVHARPGHRTAGRERVRRGTGRRGDQDAVAAPPRQRLVVDGHHGLEHPLPGRLLQRGLIDGEGLPEHRPGGLGQHAHPGRETRLGVVRPVADGRDHLVDLGGLGLGEEPDVAEVDPEDRQVDRQGPLDTAQDGAVAAEDDHQLAAVRPGLVDQVGPQVGTVEERGHLPGIGPGQHTGDVLGPDPVHELHRGPHRLGPVRVGDHRDAAPAGTLRRVGGADDGTGVRGAHRASLNAAGSIGAQAGPRGDHGRGDGERAEGRDRAPPADGEQVAAAPPHQGRAGIVEEVVQGRRLGPALGGHDAGQGRGDRVAGEEAGRQHDQADDDDGDGRHPGEGQATEHQPAGAEQDRTPPEPHRGAGRLLGRPGAGQVGEEQQRGDRGRQRERCLLQPEPEVVVHGDERAHQAEGLDEDGQHPRPAQVRDGASGDVEQ